jgi:hypothetical protein
MNNEDKTIIYCTTEKCNLEIIKSGDCLGCYFGKCNPCLKINICNKGKNHRYKKVMYGLSYFGSFQYKFSGEKNNYTNLTGCDGECSCNCSLFNNGNCPIQDEVKEELTGMVLAGVLMKKR